MIEEKKLFCSILKSIYSEHYIAMSGELQATEDAGSLQFHLTAQRVDTLKETVMKENKGQFERNPT